eukprot:GFYU01002115.1.p1 GENE.GFYU01002115.1~~GFYU01002115.1.p1  ORF type:complete len:456 (+),score=69.76 GFYU01002115.1:121-1488(+)
MHIHVVDEQATTAEQQQQQDEAKAAKTACEPCRRHHRACDGRAPVCSRCLRIGNPNCVYVTPSKRGRKKSGPNSGGVSKESLRKEIQNLKAQLAKQAHALQNRDNGVVSALTSVGHDRLLTGTVTSGKALFNCAGHLTMCDEIVAKIFHVKAATEFVGFNWRTFVPKALHSVGEGIRKLTVPVTMKMTWQRPNSLTYFTCDITLGKMVGVGMKAMVVDFKLESLEEHGNTLPEAARPSAEKLEQSSGNQLSSRQLESAFAHTTTNASLHPVTAVAPVLTPPLTSHAGINTTAAQVPIGHLDTTSLNSSMELQFQYGSGGLKASLSGGDSPTTSFEDQRVTSVDGPITWSHGDFAVPVVSAVDVASHLQSEMNPNDEFVVHEDVESILHSDEAYLDFDGVDVHTPSSSGDSLISTGSPADATLVSAVWTNDTGNVVTPGALLGSISLPSSIDQVLL